MYIYVLKLMLFMHFLLKHSTMSELNEMINCACRNKLENDSLNPDHSPRRGDYSSFRMYRRSPGLIHGITSCKSAQILRFASQMFPDAGAHPSPRS